MLRSLQFGGLLLALARICGSTGVRRWPVCANEALAGASDTGGRRLSVEEATCALRCAADEPTLQAHLKPWAEDETILPLSRLKSFCRRRHGTLTVAAAILNGSVYWRKCHDDGDSDLCMNPFEDFHTRAWLNLVQELAEAVEMPDLVFMAQCSDQPAVDKRDYPPFPVFHSEGGHEVWNVPWLNPFHLARFYNGELEPDGWRGTDLWEERQDKVYWRGTLSMPADTPVEAAGELPRVRIFHVARESPALFDIAITGIDEDATEQWGPGEPERIVKEHRIRRTRWQSFTKFAPRFKYLLNVDGVISSWRLTDLLASGSVLILQNSSSYEALYPLLTPWKHFVPIKGDMTDLLAALHYLSQHQDEAKRIADAASELFHARVRSEDTYCYALRSLISLVGPGARTRPEDLRRLRFKKAPLARTLFQRGELTRKGDGRRHVRLRERFQRMARHVEL